MPITIGPLKNGFPVRNGLVLSSGGAEISGIIASDGNPNTITWEDSIVGIPGPKSVLCIDVNSGDIYQNIDGSRTGDGITTGWRNIRDHNAQLNLTDDTHTQYLPRNGSRPMTGNLDMDSLNIDNATLINGINILSHGSRHNPGAADPLSTGTPSTISNDSSNTEGTANSFARSDHLHKVELNVPGFTANNTVTTSITTTFSNIGTESVSLPTPGTYLLSACVVTHTGTNSTWKLGFLMEVPQ